MLLAGAARREITPASQMASWVDFKPFDKVIDPLFVRALVLSDGSNRVALLSCDLTDTRETMTANLRQAIEQATGIPAANILINASHTHSAPLSPLLGDPWLSAKRRDFARVEAGAFFKPWSSRLSSNCVEAVREAKAALRPASLAIGRALVPEVLFNRRPVRPDGRVETVFEPPDPFSLAAGLKFGPLDPTLTVLALKDGQGNNLDTIFSLPCHAVCVYPKQRGLSADWPGAAAAQLQEALGGQAQFLQGCAGDIVPARRGLAAAREIGQLVGRRALSAYTNSLRLPPAPLHCRRFPLDLPLNQAARRELQQLVVKTEIQIIACGPVAIVALPGEPLIELAMQIQDRSPFPHTLVLGYSNGNGVEYVGMPGEKRRGGYEMTEAVGAGADDCGALLLNAAIQQLRELAQSLPASGALPGPRSPP